jgi:hypothetical protein
VSPLPDLLEALNLLYAVRQLVFDFFGICIDIIWSGVSPSHFCLPVDTVSSWIEQALSSEDNLFFYFASQLPSITLDRVREAILDPNSWQALQRAELLLQEVLEVGEDDGGTDLPPFSDKVEDVLEELRVIEKF